MEASYVQRLNIICCAVLLAAHWVDVLCYKVFSIHSTIINDIYLAISIPCTVIWYLAARTILMNFKGFHNAIRKDQPQQDPSITQTLTTDAPTSVPGDVDMEEHDDKVRAERLLHELASPKYSKALNKKER